MYLFPVMSIHISFRYCVSMASQGYGILSPSFALPKPARKSSLSSIKSTQEPVISSSRLGKPLSSNPVPVNRGRSQSPHSPKAATLGQPATPRKVQFSSADASNASNFQSEDFISTTVDRLLTEEVVREILLGEFKTHASPKTSASPKKSDSVERQTAKASPAPKVLQKTSSDASSRKNRSQSPKKPDEAIQPGFTESSESEIEPPLRRNARKIAPTQPSEAPVGSLVRTRMRPRKEISPSREVRKPPAARAAPKRR